MTRGSSLLAMSAASFTLAVASTSGAQTQNAGLVEKTVTFVAISSIERCKDVKLNKSGQELVAEMSAKLRAGDPTVRSVGASAAALEMKLMRKLKYCHCKDVQQRYPKFVELTGTP